MLKSLTDIYDPLTLNQRLELNIDKLVNDVLELDDGQHVTRKSYIF